MHKPPLMQMARKGFRRPELVFSWAVWAALSASFLFSLLRGEFVVAAVALLTLGLTLTPFLFQKRFDLELPGSFLLAIILFIAATLYLGEVSNFYERFWWWDLLLHGGSALGFGIIGFLIMLYLSQSSKLLASPLLIAIFSFSFAVAIGALWEIFEFAMDQIFGLNMQKSGLYDTMGDLIVDVFGAGLAAASGYVYLRFGHQGAMTKLIHDFCRRNLALFRKRPIVRNVRRAARDE